MSINTVIQELATAPLANGDLVERAVRNATRTRLAVNHLRWWYVMDVFAIGSTAAKELCRHFDLDPDEEIPGRQENDE